MATIASLVVTVGANLVEFERGIQKAERQLSTLSSAVDRIGSSMQTAGKVMTAGITLPILAVGAAAVKLGMDAVESENLVSVSFGNMRASADEWSKHLSASLGLNQFELRKTAGTLFNMTTSMGLGKEAAFEMSTGVVELAADMASFRNIGMEEALQKIQAGLTGEADPLKRLGILVDEATVKTYAYKLGIAKQGEELTAQQKILARYQAILAQTKNDQGDLARTLESPANQLRIMRTRVEEAATSLGVALMPIVQQVIAGVAAMVPYIQHAVEWFTELSPSVRLAAVAAVGMVAATGPLLYLMGGMLQTLPGLIALWRAYETAQIAAKLASIGLNVAMIGIAGAIGAAVVALGLLYAASQKWNVTTGQSNEELEKQVLQLKKVGGTMALSRAAAIERELAERKAAEATHAGTNANADFEAQLKRQAGAMQEEIKRQLALAAAIGDTGKKAKETQSHMIAMFDAANRMRNEGFAVNMNASMAAQGIVRPGQKDLIGEGLVDPLGNTEALRNTLMTSPALRGQKSAGSLAATTILGGLGDTVRTQMGPTIIGALQGGGNVFNSVAGTIGGSISKSIFGSEAMGKSISSIFGKTVGGALNSVLPGIGSLVGPAITGITKLFGNLFGGEGKKTNKERDEFLKSIEGGAAGLREMARNAGIADSQVNLLFDTKKTKTFEAAAKSVSDQLKTFADESAADAERLTAAIQKYGFSIEELGPKLQKQKLGEQAKDLIEDWRVLVAAGIDVSMVNDKMASSINEFLQTAINVGSEVPNAMRPILQSLMDQGKLVDQNGNLITDFAAAGVSFSETMTQGFDRVVKKLDELLTRLGMASSALASLPMPDFNMPSIVPPKFDDYAYPMAEGGMGRVTRPTLFLAGEAGAEDFMFSGGNRRFGSGSDSSVVVKAIEALGQKIARRDEVLPIQLMAAMQKGLA